MVPDCINNLVMNIIYYFINNVSDIYQKYRE
jgi:hypothetical protein